MLRDALLRRAAKLNRRSSLAPCASARPLRTQHLRLREHHLLSRATQDGMSTLRTDDWRRVLHGQTTVEEVARVTQADEAISETD